MARQFEFMRNSSQSSKSKCNPSPHTLCPAPSGRRQIQGESNAWGQRSSPAELWAGLVRPLLSTPSMSSGSMMTCRHFLLSVLENSPACQVAFEVFPDLLVIRIHVAKLIFTTPLLLFRICVCKRPTRCYKPAVISGSHVVVPTKQHLDR